MVEKESKYSQIITCELGCINYHINSNREYCWGQGLMQVAVSEGNKCQRGYTNSDMDKILAQEEAENKKHPPIPNDIEIAAHRRVLGL